MTIIQMKTVLLLALHCVCSALQLRATAGSADTVVAAGNELYDPTEIEPDCSICLEGLDNMPRLEKMVTRTQVHMFGVGKILLPGPHRSPATLQLQALAG